MGKSSGGEAAHTLDSHGNQVSTHGDGGAVSASREIFQGLFKDLGKQAMAMESILRLVCGKVDKLENWVTEMSFGMTELDLQLRNIAHNIEGTAANVDDVPSASRWAVPQEQNDAPTATVVKKVGVGLNKKKQMRMTGMVANILDQLTAVAETPPPAVESESESHKGDDKKKAKAKAKKAKASVSGVVSPLSATSAATTPRAGETAADKPKTSKKKAHKHADAGITEEPATAAAMTVEVDHAEEEPVQSKIAVAAEDLRNALEDHVDATVAEQNEGPGSLAPVNDADLPHGQREVEPSVVPAPEAEPVDEPKEAGGSTDNDAPIGITPVEDEEVVGKHQNVDTPVQERGEESSIDSIAIPNDDDAGLDVQLAPPTNEVELTQPAGLPLQHPVDATLDVGEPTPLEITEEPAPVQSSNEHPAIAEKEAPPQLDLSHEEIGVNSVTAEHMDQQDQHLETHEEAAVAEVSPVAEDPTNDPNQASAVTSSSMGTRIELADTVQNHPAPSPPCSITGIDGQQKSVAAEHDTPPVERPSNSPPPVEASIGAEVSVGSSLPEESRLLPEDPYALLKRSPSKKLRRGGSGATNGDAQLSSPTKRGSRRASIRKSITQRQTSIKRREMQEQPVAEEAIHEAAPTASPPQEGIGEMEHKVVSEGIVARTTEPLTVSTSANMIDGKQQPHVSETTSGVIEQRVATKNEEDDDDDDEEDDDDDDDDEDSSSLMGSDSDESVLDLDERIGSKASSKVPTTAAEKKMSMKMTRTLSALNKLKKAEVLSPEEIAELKQRANQKWFKLRDHVKEKNKKDVANILLKRKKNIFTVSNRIELLEEKSREVYASIKQLNTELKGKVETATFEGLRRHVHDINVSLQVLDDKISKGNTPAMDHIKQLAKDTEAMRLFFLEQLELARTHCDGNHGETITLFDAQWQRVLEIEKSIRDKLTSLVTEYDDKLHDLPDYTEALEGIRRAVRKKADLKALRELETRLLGHDAEAEDCLVRCLSCHKEVVNAGHETSHPQDDNEPGGVGSPHFKRVNPGPSSARVYRSNVPLNAQPLGVPDAGIELVGQPQSNDAVPLSGSSAGSTSKSLTPSRGRTIDTRPSPLSFIHVTATRAISANADGNRPISAPASAGKKKPQPRSGAQQ